jgi:hypothetical protein
VCAPWCEDGDGHPDSLVRDEQTCWGPSAYVDLSLQDVTRDSSGVYVPRVGVMAYREWPAVTPIVYVHLDGIETHTGGRRDTLDESVHLTAAEAIALATALLKAAGEIKGDPSGPASRLI